MNSFMQSGNYVYHLLKHSTTLPSAHSVFMCVTRLSQHTPTVCLHCINWSDFTVQTVHCAVRTGYSNTLIWLQSASHNHTHAGPYIQTDKAITY